MRGAFYRSHTAQVHHTGRSVTSRMIVLHWFTARGKFCRKIRNYFFKNVAVVCPNRAISQPICWNPALERMGAFKAIIDPAVLYCLICPIQGDQLKRLPPQQVTVAETGVFDIS